MALAKTDVRETANAYSKSVKDLKSITRIVIRKATIVTARDANKR